MQSPLERPVQTVLTDSLQVADIMAFVISAIGPSEIWQTTFSVAEEFLRRLWFFRKAGKITAAHVLLDHKACNKILKLWPFISNAYDSAHMGDNHSKILLMKSDSGHKVAVITSQNLTRGNRYESTVILADSHAFDSLLESFRDITTNHAIPLNDLLADRFRED